MKKLKEEFPSLDFAQELEWKTEEFKMIFEEECKKAADQIHREKEKYPKFKLDLSKYVLITGLPLVEEEKYEKFFGVITNVMSKQSINVPKENVSIPRDDKNCTKGFMIIKSANDKEAFEIVEKMSVIKLGKNSLKAILLDDFDGRLEASKSILPDMDAASLLSYQNANSEDYILSYCTEERNQNLLIFNMQIDPKSFTLQEQMNHIKLITLENAHKLEWSPNGTFLSLIKKNYVILYGSANMTELRKFCHKDVSGFKISPDEKMIVTYSPKDNAEDADELGVIKVWDILSETEVRRFTGTGEKQVHIKWSFDGKLLAIMRKDMLSIYEAPDMKMMMDPNNNRTSIKAENITDFHWALNSNKLFMVYTIADITKMQIRELPSRLDIVTKSYSGVKSCRIKWHPKENYIGLCISFTPPKKSIKIDDSLVIIDYSSKQAANFEIHFQKIFDFDFQPLAKGFLAMTLEDKSHKHLLKVYKDQKTIDKSFEYSTIYSNPGEGMVHWNKLGTFLALAYSKGEFDSEVFLYCVDNELVKQYERFKYDYNDFAWSSSGTLFSLRKREEFLIYSAGGISLISKKLVNSNIMWRPNKIMPTNEEMEEIRKCKPALAEEYKKKARQVQMVSQSTKIKKYMEFVEKNITPRLKLYEEHREEREKLLGRKEYNEALYASKILSEEEKILESKIIEPSANIIKEAEPKVIS